MTIAIVAAARPPSVVTITVMALLHLATRQILALGHHRVAVRRHGVDMVVTKNRRRVIIIVNGLRYFISSTPSNN